MNSTPPKGNILIADDTLVNLRLLSKILTEDGYKVRGVPNGIRAIKAARLSSPDLILLDIMMPDMNGYQVCEILKADERTCNIPIIFLSALHETLNKIKAFSIGGVDYITKPFEVEEVLARVKTHVTLQTMQKQLQQMNAKLIDANNALQISNEEYDAFAQTVAHDLNNPLSIILGYSEMLEHTNPSPTDTKYYLQTISQTAHKMRDIINELLLLAGVRKAEVTIEPLDMANIVAAVQERLITMIKKQQVHIVLPKQWPEAMGYAPWIEEVWANYLSNGIKYGGKPPYLELGATKQPNNMIQFWVQDNGPGLTPEEQNQLFVPFIRLSQLKVDGHGLGLSIVQRIMKKLNGQVGVESIKGKGSKFSFTLPEQISN